MRTAILFALAIALVLVLWWSRAEEHARAERPEPPAPPEAPAPPAPGPEMPDAAPPAEEAAEPAEALPPDPVERGGCALFIRFVDAATGQPVATSIDLWRLDAPGNEGWLEGDQLQLIAEIAAAGTTLEDLPEGEYRPVCGAQRHAAEDPPPVRVAGPLTEVTIAIELPGTFHVFLKLYDANGHLVPEASVRRSGDGWSQRRYDPRWRKRRELRNPPPEGGQVIGTGGGAATGRFSGRRGRPESQPVTGYRLGPVGESPKRRSTRQYYGAELDGFSDVSLSVDGDRTDERAYVGVMVPIETLARYVQLPDGRLATVAGARISARCVAVLAEKATQGDFWRHLPIEVDVQLPGYKKLRFEYRLADPPPVHVLDPE